VADQKAAAGDDPLAALQELELTHDDPMEDLDRLVLLAADICGANLAAFTVHDATTAHEVSSSFGARATMPKQECMCSTQLASNQTLHVPDATADPRLASTRYVAGAPFVRSFVGVPIGIEPGLPIGVLAIGHTEVERFGAREIERLTRVSELLAAFLSQRRAAIRARRAAKTTEADRQRQHLFELIFNAIQEGVNVQSARRGVVEMNPACLSIMGLTREDAMSRTRTDPRWRTFRPDGSLYSPDEFPAFVTLRSGKAFQNERLGIELPNGEKRWLSVNTVPLRHAETNEVEFAVVTMKDVTEQRLAEAQLMAQNTQLVEALELAEKASRAKTDFMGVMSHELRTPMNAITGCALLISQSTLDPVQRRTLGVLEDAGKQMLAVLNDLFDLSALNADKVRIEVEPVSMLRLIEDAAVIWASKVRVKHLSLTVMIDRALSPMRFVDSARLLQIIGNLIANAIKFTSEGGITLRAWPERGPGRPNGVAIEVEDTGPGVPPEAAERIFQPFEQIDVSAKRRHGGLGLGLPIARRLAQAMGGDIELDTLPGQGSRFTVRIEAPQANAIPVRPIDLRASNDTDAPVSRDILCVDDNPRNLFVLAGLLRAAGHRATECGTGHEALEILKEKKFDLVLLDMVMPDMDGLDVLARLREEAGPNSDTPVIACTANVLPDQIAAYRKAGSADVIAKPIDPRAMLRAVANAA
jgi:PAS domain S-box-containing protein